jgi:hypothetical protein
MIFLPSGVLLILWAVYELKTKPEARELLSSGGCGLIAGLLFVGIGVICLLMGTER